MNLKNYIQGKRSGKEANRLERQAQENPFLHDAIDGFDNVAGNHLYAIESLEKKLEKRLKKLPHSKAKSLKWRRVAAIAASLALLFGHANATVDSDNVKKSQKANLEPHKATYWLMGIVLAAALIIFALEWTTETNQLDERLWAQGLIVEEEIPETHREPPPPPPPPPPMPPVAEFIEIVEEEVQTQIVIEEITDEGITQVAPPPPPPPPSAPAFPIDHIFEVVEQQPEFPGGMAALMTWLNNNIRYPMIATEQGIQGRVTVSFVVERDGSITDVQVLRGVDPSLDREAIRVVSAMPHWTPGKQQGQAVRARFNLPVTFRLQ